MPDWSHQPRTIEQVTRILDGGCRAVVITIPMGGGKSILASLLARQEVSRGGRVVIYSNRRVIHEQLHRTFGEQGLDPGARAAGIQPRFYQPVQVSSIDTDYTRAIRGDAWDLHNATLAIIDEAHSNRAAKALAIINRHREAGCKIVGLTATPVGIGHIYDRLVIGAKVSELRRQGVLVACDVYAPDEVDLHGVKIRQGEFSRAEAADRVKRCLIIGSVIEHWRRLNPDRRPTVLFAPGVRESRYFCEELIKAGVAADHIDASTKPDVRQRIFDGLRIGEIEIVCNCGVLREGWNLPEVSHAILAAPTRKLSTYLQMVGRILRACQGKDRAVLQDHVGAWWRHGSPNADIAWTLDDTDADLMARRNQEIGNGEQPAPVRCPKCGQIRISVPPDYAKCKCGHTITRSVRVVRQIDGKLVKKEGVPLLNHRAKSKTPEDLRAYRSAIFQAMHRDMTASQVHFLAMKALGNRPIDKELLGNLYVDPRSAEYHLPASKIPQWRWIKEAVARQKK